MNLGLAAALRGAPAPVDLVVDLLPLVEDAGPAIALLGATGEWLTETVLASCDSGCNYADRQALYLYMAVERFDGAPPPPELLVTIRQTSRNPQTPQSRILLGLAGLKLADPNVLAVLGRMVEEAEAVPAQKLGELWRANFDLAFVDLPPPAGGRERFGGFTVTRTAEKVGRNDPCPCGSGKKHKRCCLGSAAPDGPTPDRAAIGDGAGRYHASMSEKQFGGLHPVQLLRIPPTELSTPRLERATRAIARFRRFDAAERFLTEYMSRPDRATGRALDECLADVIGPAVVSGQPDVVERLGGRCEDPDGVRLAELAAALLRKAPDSLVRMEEFAKTALTDESGEAADSLSHLLLLAAPAFGIFFARGALASGRIEHARRLLERIECSRDELLLPPQDPAWLVNDLLVQHEIDRQAESEAAEESEKLAAERDALERGLRAAKAREAIVRRQLGRQERKLARAVAAAERAREDAERARGTDGITPGRIADFRREMQNLRLTIAEGNEERRGLRERLARLGERIEAAREEGEPEGEEDVDGLETEDEAVRERLTARFPTFSDGVGSAVPHVGRSALATAGQLAGADPAAWTGVKRIKAIDGLLSVRLGRYRALFRLAGEDGIDFERLVHRRDLEVTLRRMA